ncbi:MAG: hypothetical protein ACKOJF_08650, partial [Planctomycetaceae bacterium]
FRQKFIRGDSGNSPRIARQTSAASPALHAPAADAPPVPCGDPVSSPAAGAVERSCEIPGPPPLAVAPPGFSPLWGPTAAGEVPAVAWETGADGETAWLEA